MAYPKETVEAAVGLIALAGVLAQAGKDGLQWTDVAVVAAKLQEEPLKSKLAAAQEGIEKVQGEVQDVKTADLFAALAIIGPELATLLEQLSKKA